MEPGKHFPLLLGTAGWGMSGPQAETVDNIAHGLSKLMPAWPCGGTLLGSPPIPGIDVRETSYINTSLQYFIRREMILLHTIEKNAIDLLILNEENAKLIELVNDLNDKVASQSEIIEKQEHELLNYKTVLSDTNCEISILNNKIKEDKIKIKELNDKLEDKNFIEEAATQYIANLSNSIADDPELFERLKEKLNNANHMIFGKSSEKLSAIRNLQKSREKNKNLDSNSGENDNSQNSEDGNTSSDGSQNGSSQKNINSENSGSMRHTGRQAMPAGLPEKIEKLFANQNGEYPLCPCCGMPMSHCKFIEDTEIGVEPIKFYKKTTRREVAHCTNPQCYGSDKEREHIVPMDTRMFNKSWVSIYLIALAAYYKYEYSIPLYRLVKMFKHGNSAIVSRTTLSRYIIIAAEYLMPLYEKMMETLKYSIYLHADETRINVLKVEKDHCYVWVFATDGSYASRQMFYFSKTRGSQVLLDILGDDFYGYLQSDDYSAYIAFLDKNENMIAVRCLAHIRRYFAKIILQYASPDKTCFAVIIIDLIAEIYKADDKIRIETKDNKKPSVILALRRERVLPLFNKLKEILEKNVNLYPNTLMISRAIKYALKNIDMLNPYFENEQIRLDNNRAENLLRTVAVGRKNWLFCVSEAGARAATVFMSLTATAKSMGIDPYKYIEYLMLNIPKCVTRKEEDGKVTVTVTDPKKLKSLLPEFCKSIVNARASPS
jgi:transposase